ncbi:MAG: hypothetical protein WCS97_02875 [Candidatus Paceibacterota bacterium]|jgi:hypothetical protein
MRSNLLVPVIAAVLVVAGFFFFYYGKSPASAPSANTKQTSTDTSAQTQDSTATNYDECIAEGNQPLSDAPDKCLTKDGHLFIQGVVE